MWVAWFFLTFGATALVCLGMQEPLGWINVVTSALVATVVWYFAEAGEDEEEE